jgi:hypothetical protein
MNSRTSQAFGALAAPILFAVSAAAATAVTNVTLANVTPASFSVVWRAPSSTPSLAVFADPAGTIDLTGQFAIALHPLEAGSPQALTDYDQRQVQSALRQQTRRHNLAQVRVGGCQPGATYYFRAIAAFADGSSQVYPETGPLPGVTLPRASGFVVHSQQLLLDVPGLDTFGRIVLLSHPDAAYALAGVVGDGTQTNQVFFNLSDLFALTGGQFDPRGNQQFTLELLGPGRTSVVERFAVQFNDAFTIAQTSLAAFGLDYAALRLGSTVLRAGDTGSVPVTLDASENLATLSATLELPADRFDAIALSDLAAAIDPTASRIVRLSSAACRLELAARAGQQIPAHGTLVQIGFAARTGLPSALVALKTADLTASRPDGRPIAHLLLQSGRIAVVADQPLLEATRAASGARELTLFGRPGSTCAVESSADPTDPSSWALFTRLHLTALSAPVPGIEPGPPAVYYRAVEVGGDLPFLVPLLNPDGTRSLIAYGQPSRQYTLLQTTDFTHWVTWQPILTYTLTGTSRRIELPASTDSVVYRLRRD